MKMDLALNNQQRLICHKTQQTKPNKKDIMPKILEQVKSFCNFGYGKFYRCHEGDKPY